MNIKFNIYEKYLKLVFKYFDKITKNITRDALTISKFQQQKNH